MGFSDEKAIDSLKLREKQKKIVWSIQRNICYL